MLMPVDSQARETPKHLERLNFNFGATFPLAGTATQGFSLAH
jgi:hypothetical protein